MTMARNPVVTVMAIMIQMSDTGYHKLSPLYNKCLFHFFQTWLLFWKYVPKLWFLIQCPVSMMYEPNLLIFKSMYFLPDLF